MSSWRPYMTDRMIYDHPSGFKVIKPAVSSQDAQPIFCAVCTGIMRSLYDEDAYFKFQCCDSCASTWAYPNKDKWSKGWRPSAEDVRNKLTNTPM